MNSYCTDQLVLSNLRSGFFQDKNDRPVNSEIVLIFFYLQFFLTILYFSILVQNSLLLKTVLTSCFFQNFISWLRLCLLAHPKLFTFLLFWDVARMFQEPFRWGTHLLSLGASLTSISFPHQRSHIITLSLPWHLFYCKQLSLSESPPQFLNCCLLKTTCFAVLITFGVYIILWQRKIFCMKCEEFVLQDKSLPYIFGSSILYSSLHSAESITNNTSKWIL